MIIALTIHEAMHAFVGFKLGDNTAHDEGRLTLNPLKHIDPYTTILLPLITLVLFHVPVLAARPVPFNPYLVKFREFGGALIAIAGPLSNLLLAFIAVTIVRFTSLPYAVYDFFRVFISLNISLFVFNILPIPPLDGSRVLYAFSPSAFQDFLKKIEPYGLFIVFGLVLTGSLTTLIISMNNAVLRLLI
jgi:Zn-dependent protease